MRKESVYRGRVINLVVEGVQLPNGSSVDLEIIRHPGAAAVAAVDDDGQVLLLHQYRHAAGGMLWEVPAGTLDPGEDPLECARRELEEEAGVRAQDLTRLGAIFTCPGFCDERIHIFLATGLRRTARAPERDEIIDEIVTVPMPKALDLIGSGAIQDAKSIVAIHHASRYLQVAKDR